MQACEGVPRIRRNRHTRLVYHGKHPHMFVDAYFEDILKPPGMSVWKIPLGSAAILVS